jgi:predicted secreted Zn-dependent protease
LHGSGQQVTKVIYTLCEQNTIASAQSTLAIKWSKELQQLKGVRKAYERHAKSVRKAYERRTKSIRKAYEKRAKGVRKACEKRTKGVRKAYEKHAKGMRLRRGCKYVYL